jgi:hypothetical protein
VTRLCGEPTLGHLRAALSIPLTDLFVVREPEVCQRSDMGRIQLLDRLGIVFYNAAHLTGDTKPYEVEVAACRLSEIQPAGQDPLFDFLPLVNEGDSYGSRRGVFCFIVDCPPGVLR